MIALAVHALLYLAVNVLLVLLWLLLGGDWSGADDPLAAAREAGFWPFWVAAIWGVGLALHAALTGAIKRWRSRRKARKDQTAAESRTAATQTQWVAAMFTDIVGSTTLTTQLGDAAYGDVLASHRQTVREIATAHGGTEIGTQGDGFLLTFETPRQAVDCAVALQRRLAGERDDAKRIPHVRIGLHAGEVHRRDGDVIGQMVHVAARVAGVAEGDEIVVTELVAEHAPRDLGVDDLGLRDLDDLPTPRHLLAVRWDVEAG